MAIALWSSHSVRKHLGTRLAREMDCDRSPFLVFRYEDVKAENGYIDMLTLAAVAKEVWAFLERKNYSVKRLNDDKDNHGNEVGPRIEISGW